MTVTEDMRPDCGPKPQWLPLGQTRIKCQIQTPSEGAPPNAAGAPSDEQHLCRGNMCGGVVCGKTLRGDTLRGGKEKGGRKRKTFYSFLGASKTPADLPRVFSLPASLQRQHLRGDSLRGKKKGDLLLFSEAHGSRIVRGGWPPGFTFQPSRSARG